PTDKAYELKNNKIRVIIMIKPPNVILETYDRDVIFKITEKYIQGVKPLKDYINLSYKQMRYMLFEITSHPELVKYIQLVAEPYTNTHFHSNESVSPYVSYTDIGSDYANDLSDCAIWIQHEEIQLAYVKLYVISAYVESNDTYIYG